MRDQHEARSFEATDSASLGEPALTLLKHNTQYPGPSAYATHPFCAQHKK